MKVQQDIDVSKCKKIIDNQKPLSFFIHQSVVNFLKFFLVSQISIFELTKNTLLINE